MNTLNRSDNYPEGPDPGLAGAIFPGWLKKRGAIRRISDCERKCEKNGFTAKAFIKSMGVERIRIGEMGNGRKVIKLVDTPWADRWMTYYDVEVPHHRHWKKI
ncbi:hypothetical protein FTO68_02480 [Methanocalculus taiwanensis]|uniref:Uncharacterized protein n=1 Tax=Methanocalculus taiwanensis TaxID=106207 RepID=A0ABD4TJ90_9EURY|nr:hypothetical protein [Methanocalculus taiwanensis]